jgi:hypothetical protein
MILWILFTAVFCLSLGFVAGAGWRAMFSGPFPVTFTDEAASDYPGTGTEFEAWGTD